MSFFDDLGKGITDAVNARTAQYTADNTSSAAVSGNTGAYWGQSIVDVVSTYITTSAETARKSLVDKFTSSGTGSKMVDDARMAEIQRLLSSPTTWIVAGLVIFGFVMLGRASR